MSKREERYLALRNKTVVKANDLIQKSRFSLSVQQQKIVLYLISQIMPFDEEFKLYEFSISEFCRVCGIDYNGRSYKDLKDQIQKIADKSVWVRLPDGRETLLRWIDRPYIDDKSGTIQIKLDEFMKPYLLQLKQNFTSYELIYTLSMRSRYSIRLYEIVKSIHFHELKNYKRRYDLDELRRILDAEKYQQYRNFNQKVLKSAVDEINRFTDKMVSYEAILKGRKTIAVEFTISTKEAVERIRVRDRINKELGMDQVTLWDGEWGNE